MVMNPMDVRDITRDQVAAAAAQWWILLVTGIVSIVAGILILTINWTLADLAFVIGFLFIFRGVMTLLTPPADGSSRGWNIFIGVVEILAGIGTFAWPGTALFTIAIFVGVWLIIWGLFLAVGAFVHRHHVPLWGIPLVMGVISALLGFWALERPTLTIAVLVTVAGFWALFMGILECIMAFEVKHLPARLDRMAAGTTPTGAAS